MKKSILSIVSAFIVIINCASQTPINQELKKELAQILFTDQIYRELHDPRITDVRRLEIARLTNHTPEDLQKNLYFIMKDTDSANLARVEKIVEQYGYPGKTLVGEPENIAVFYVIQHAPDKIPQYYPLIEEAAKKGELPFRLTAMMLDRMLADEGKEQIYGTQIYSRRITNKETGKEENFMYVVPIKDPQNVNQRRKEAGFDTTVEENAKDFGMDYKVYSYEELKKILE